MEFKCSNLTIRLKDGKPIVENLSFFLNKGDKLALIGEEGNGKSTIIKMLVNPHFIEDYCTYQGSVSISDYTIGYLRQSLDEFYTMDCLSYLYMNDQTNQINFENQHKLYIIKKLFHEFKLSETILNRSIATLSGGEKIKLQLVKIEFQQASLLILDEPTNDLDLTSLLFLQDYILKTSRPIIYVSHDGEFLAATANRILHLEQIKRKSEVVHTLYNGDYSSYIDQRATLQQKQDAKAYQEEKNLFEKREVLRQFKSKLEHQLRLAVRQPTWGRLLAKKMRVVTTQERKLNEEEASKTQYSRPETQINLRFSSTMNSIPSGKTILNMTLSQLAIPSRPLIRDIRLFVKGSEHVCIIGENGIGKTTLLKIILEELRKTSNIKIGYLPQDYQEVLPYEAKVLDFLMQDKIGDNAYKGQVMTYLSAANFLEYELYETIGRLSGGQKTKVLLIKLILEEANVLVLDEPTRNLSSLSAPVMLEMLSDFTGSIIAVSHDRSFIKSVCDSIYLLDKQGLHLVTKNDEF